MSIGIVADVHVGNHRQSGGEMTCGVNVRCREVLDVLEMAAREVRTLVVAGDLFDVSNPSPQVITATAEALSSAEEVVILVGIHERVSMRDGDHALGPLGLLPNVTVVQNSTVLHIEGTCLVCIPHHVGRPMEWLPDELDKLDFPDGSILVTHVGIADDGTPPWLVNSDCIHIGHVNLLCDEYRLRGVVVGDWHGHKWWRHGDVSSVAKAKEAAHIVQVGALVPTGWDNPGVSGYGVVLKVPEFRGRRFPGPRFVTVGSLVEAEEALSEAHGSGATVRIRVRAAQDDNSEARVDALRNDPVCKGLTFEVPKGLSREAADNAVASIRAGGSVEDMVLQYIEGMELNDKLKEAVISAAVSAIATSGGE